MEQIVLQALRRETKGKGAARQSRREGRVPGVVYGLDMQPLNISVVADDLESAVTRFGGGSVLVDLRVEGIEHDTARAALIREIQRHPVSRQAESIDLYWVSLAETVTVIVPVEIVGTSPAETAGAVIDHVVREIEVSCRPLEIPRSLFVNIDGMEMHDTRTVADLQLPDGVTTALDPDTVIVTCTPPTREEEPRGEEEVEGEIQQVSETEG